jgi:hypothetical protein
VDEELEFAARNLGASALRTALTVALPLAAPGLMAAAIFVFLESLDEFTGTYFVGVPDVTTLPLIMFTASLAGNYQIAAVTALILLAVRSRSLADMVRADRGFREGASEVCGVIQPAKVRLSGDRRENAARQVGSGICPWAGWCVTWPGHRPHPR